EREWLDCRRLLALVLQLVIDLLDFVLLEMVSDFVVTVANIHDGDVVDHAPVLDLAVRRLDETVVVDAGVAAQGRDQADVRTFRRLNGADTSVVRGVNVADFESGALA